MLAERLRTLGCELLRRQGGFADGRQISGCVRGEGDSNSATQSHPPSPPFICLVRLLTRPQFRLTLHQPKAPAAICTTPGGSPVYAPPPNPCCGSQPNGPTLYTPNRSVAPPC